MSRLKIAIACQGGGSQTAFTAGALKTLCEARIDDEFEVVGISGTSGGVGGAEVGPVAGEGLGPLVAGVVEAVGDQVGGVVLPAAGHRHVGGRGAGVLGHQTEVDVFE